MSRISIVAFGGGTDSTAELIEMVKRGEPAPHTVLFGDTEGEHPHTYAHIWRFSQWLLDHGYPAITIVHAGSSGGEGLEAMCLRLGVLPSVAYGWKTCSQRFKVEPQEKWINNDPACRAARAAGDPITMCIGYEYGEERRVRPSAMKGVVNRYPLIEWKMDREACVETIRAAGLPPPGKSSCFFCPNMTKPEIGALQRMYSTLAARALAMEANAAASGKSRVAGLGRRFAWGDYLAGLPTPAVAEQPDPCGCYDGDESLTDLPVAVGANPPRDDLWDADKLSKLDPKTGIINGPF